VKQKVPSISLLSVSGEGRRQRARRIDAVGESLRVACSVDCGRQERPKGMVTRGERMGNLEML